MAAKTVAEKLVIKPGHSVWTSHPDRFAGIGALPAGAGRTDDLATADVAVLYADDADSARALLTANKADVAKPPVVWIAYPKANRTDINRDSLWPIVVEFGMRPNGQVAIDEVWSALRFRADKPGEEPFKGGAKK
ncbi:hypothetical protein KGQ20_21575 [Catenulispora sp. NF23]|uniref:DUF3052 domain-containing protein n=1 Tax=Catenulispora pinistramenti TaxID=2705254 RepID=A0ABS5KLY5_9ACTN|nr:hypothetical protein [Catenulispora pinistramenti]MBS2535359.1 hypothetical protein [Catenulispora pinistramenti]MBS2547062.1 hypothetical protein [Catenulispora pinistramenti]